jgi:hypothetical protein
MSPQYQITIQPVQCQTCRADAPDGSRFCPSCGRTLLDEEAFTRLSGGASALPDVTRPSAPDDLTADLAFQSGETLVGRYRIVRLLGRGGMGAVFLAEDLRLGQPVALKFLPAALASDARRLAQFHNEVSIARQISHPHVCRVYDIGDVDGHLFLSMEYVEGADLATALKQRAPFPESEGVELVRQICGGLAAVHARGVLHRDLKPANIMLNAAGHAQLMDFGIAVPGGTSGLIEGTPAYMAPEQLTGQGATIQSDLYALGLVMREIFTGSRGTETAAPGVNPRVLEVIAQCLQPEASARPASAPAVAAGLQVVLLDARTLWRRVFQIVVQFLLLPLWLVGAQSLLGRNGLGAGWGVVMIALGTLLALLVFRVPIGWTVSYKGHRIRFYNHPIRGEQLYIDGKLADRGRLGFNVTMRGTIESGAGAGERITAHSRCTFFTVSCRIVAESFLPGVRTA